MAHRLSGERVTVEVAGLPVELQPIGAWSIYQTAVDLTAAWIAAEGPAALSALQRACAYFCIEAQPTWEALDHRGVVPATPAGMMRLPMALDLIVEWAEMFVREPAETAVDKMVPPGEMRDELNRRLRAA
jgi:hypothetical protein